MPILRIVPDWSDFCPSPSRAILNYFTKLRTEADILRSILVKNLLPKIRFPMLFYGMKTLIFSLLLLYKQKRHWWPSGFTFVLSWQGGLGWAPQLYFNTSQPGPRPGAISWNTFHGSRCYVCPEIFKHEVVHCCVFQAYELFYISKNISCVRS